jgi:uncharacterized protein (TIGR03086 family)
VPNHATIADRYRILVARFDALLAAVPQERWGSASPCDGWSALDIVNHVATTEASLLARMPFASAELIDMSNVFLAWPKVSGQMQDALDNRETAGHAYDGFFGPTTFAETVDAFYSFDLVVHTWDIAKATNLPEFESIDPTEMLSIQGDLTEFGDNLRMPGILGPALKVESGADPQTSFLAFVGRNATWTV